MRMTLVAEVATAYFQLMALDNELSIVRRTLRTRSEGVQQAQLRFEGGLTSETVYQQAKVEYASTATLIPVWRAGSKLWKTVLHCLWENLLTGRCCAVK